MKASAFAVVALFILTLPILAQDLNQGILRGQILPAQGENELPALITVRIVGPGVQQITYVTGSFFTFSGLTDGDYTVYVSSNGHEEVAQEIGFSAEHSDLVTVTLGSRAAENNVPPAGDSVVDLKTLKVPDKAKEHLQKGLEYLDKQDFKQAVRHFKAALDIYPRFYQAHNNLGVALIKQNKEEEAEKQFAQAVEIEPDNVTGLKNLAYVRMNLGRQRDALAPLSRALQIGGDDPKAEMFLGEAYTLLKDRVNAKAHLLKAVLLDPSLAHADYRLGYIFLQDKEYDQALKYFQAFLKSNPSAGKEEVQGIVAKLEQYFKDSLGRSAANSSTNP